MDERLHFYFDLSEKNHLAIQVYRVHKDFVESNIPFDIGLHCIIRWYWIDEMER